MWTDYRYAPLIGRILLGAIFLTSGLNKVTNPEGTQQYMMAMGMTWATTLFYLGAIALELGGAASVMLGYWTRVGAWILIVFMIPTTLIFHSNFADQNQMIHFMKNVAMTGGLLYVATFGPGLISLDARLGGWVSDVGTYGSESTVRRRTSA